MICRFLVLVFILGSISACQSMTEPAGSVEPDYAIVPVHFATDRNFTGSDIPSEMFGSDRAPADQPISYGICKVSIPRDHRMGELESPSIWRFEFREDPTEHVVLLDTIVQTSGEFFEEMSERIESSNDKNAFLFVHGYNVTFEDAARRTAQMSYDLGFDGAPIFYSWPSRGRVSAYTIDEQSVAWSQANLKQFLEDFLVKSDATNIYLIAHSMGNRALANAVTELLEERPGFGSRLTEVILTAPDIDAEVFRRDIAPALTSAERPITLYASSRDRALMASEAVHGHTRLGDSSDGVAVLPGIETIDATSVDSSFVGHSYYGDYRDVLSDIFYIINEGKRADERFGLRRVEVDDGHYWEFKE